MRKGTIARLALALALCAGLVAAPAAQAAEPVVIGVTTSLGFLEGKESLNAVKLAVKEINEAGGVDVGGEKRPFEIRAIDIRDAAPGVPVPEALLGIEKLILEEKPHALVIGPFRSEALLAGMDMLAKHKVPLLGTIAMTPKSSGMVAKDPKYKYIFRVCLSAKYFVGYLAGTMKFLNKKFGYDKVYIMNQDVAWARATAGIMSKIFKKMKWEVLGQESFPVGASDFAPALMKAKMKGAQVILPVFDMPQSGILVKQWRSMRVPAFMAGFISPLAGSAAWKTFDQKIAGAVNSIFELGSAIPSNKYAPAAKFYSSYEMAYGKPLQAGHGPAPSYDSVYLLKQAIEKAGSTDPDAIAAALEQADHQGVIGRIKFNEGHQAIYGNDPQETAVGCMFQWNDDGSRTIVFPPAIAEGEIELPSWMKPAN
jgi:branched-chain amino acid transport system substrate-binding protein